MFLTPPSASKPKRPANRQVSAYNNRGHSFRNGLYCFFIYSLPRKAAGGAFGLIGVGEVGGDDELARTVDGTPIAIGQLGSNGITRIHKRRAGAENDGNCHERKDMFPNLPDFL